MRFRIACCVMPMLFAATSGAQNLTQRLDSVMKEAERSGFGGIVRVEKGGALVLEKGYGLAIRPSARFTPATVVQIGSNTKDFTAVSILQLQDKGKLHISDTLGKFFPNAPADKQGITVRQLLNHRAGFPLGLGGDFESVTRDQLIANAMAFKLLYTPGTNEKYSNTGYAILAAIIEKISGQSYDVYVRDNILRPLGLKHTGYLLPGFKQSELAHGYAQNGSDAGNIVHKPHAADGPYWNLRGNGGMVSTVGDMHAFYKALFETDKLLKPATRDIMFHPNEPVGLAGSDLVNFFLYERDPIAGAEIILASNDAKHPAPQVRRGLAIVLGLPLNVGGPGGGGGTPVKPNGKAPSPEIAAVINQLVAALNSGNNNTLLAFFRDHFDNSPSAPKPEDRLSRIGTLHGNVGDIKVTGMYDQGDGPVQVTMLTESQGPGTLLVNIDRTTPYRIKSVGVQIGN